MEVRSPAELDSLFTTMVRERVDAVLVHPSQMIGTHRARLAALAAQEPSADDGRRAVVG